MCGVLYKSCKFVACVASVGVSPFARVEEVENVVRAGDIAIAAITTNRMRFRMTAVVSK